jgi:hypothetical protein
MYTILPTTLGDERKTSNGSGMRSVRGIAP